MRQPSALLACLAAIFTTVIISEVGAAQRGGQLLQREWPAKFAAKPSLASQEAKAEEAEKRRDWDSAANDYRGAARTAAIQGQYQNALALATKSLDAAGRSGKPLLQIAAIQQLVYTQSVLGQLSASKTLLDRGLDLVKEVPRGPQRFNVEANLQRELGYYYYLTGDFKKSIDYGMSSLQVRETQLSFLKSRPSTPRTPRWMRLVQGALLITLHHLGNAYRENGNSDEALKAYERALTTLKNTPGTSYAESRLHQEIGELFVGLKAYPRAQEHLQRALAIGEKHRHAFVSERANSLLGDLFRQTGKPEQAIPHYRKAIENIESTRALLESENLRSSFFDDKRKTYTGMILAQLAGNNLGEAFDYSERARSRALLDLLGSKVQFSRGELRAEEKRLQEKIFAARAQALLEEDPEEDDGPDNALANQNIDEAQHAYDNFLARVRKENQEQASLMNVEPLSLKQVQALLEPQTTMLEYFVTPQQTLLWIVDKERLQHVRIPISRGDLIAKVSQLREAIAEVNDPSKAKTASQELHKLLLQPALAQLRGKALVFVPHDVLHYLPFQALSTPAGKYLIEDYSISYLSSASLMKFTKEKTRRGRSQAFVIGNPDLGDPAYDLRFAEREAREISQLYPQSAVYLKEQATKPRVITESANYDILHFATHAEFNQEYPLASALRLARENNSDGRLTAGEIFGLNLKSDMVVLSACETGLGKITNGDELIGLSRAFIYAGTPSILTTLWKVNDRASYELIRGYYAHLKTMKKSAALRQAQLQTMKEFPHPFYWAPYTLMGEP